MLSTQTRTITTQERELLTGTWPIRMHAEHFFGTVVADGQHPRVAALACYKGELVAISLVGYDTSISAVLASLWSYETVAFTPSPGVQWQGPHTLKRRGESYKQFSVPLLGTKEVQGVGLSTSAHIAEGIRHPPDLPSPSEGDYGGANAGKQTDPQPSPDTKKGSSRFLLGNWDEEYPNERSFLGALYGMRVLFLHKDDEHPEWPRIWASALWQRGMIRKLIMPLKEALGVSAWVLSSDLDAWGRLIGEGTREGWLPWEAVTPPQEETSSLSSGNAEEIAFLHAHILHDVLALSGMNAKS